MMGSRERDDSELCADVVVVADRGRANNSKQSGIETPASFFVSSTDLYT